MIDCRTGAGYGQFFDGLGRLLRTRNQVSAANPYYIYVDRTYEICSCTGKTEKVSLPG